MLERDERQYIPELKGLQNSSEFHFKEIAEIESAMISLVSQLKEKIQNGEYDSLISDDVGGRIPTLVLRRIMKAVRPDIEVGTFFVASGKSYAPNFQHKEDYSALQEYFKNIAAKTRHPLLVTQFAFRGNTLIRMVDSLKSVGVTEVDVAAVDVMPNFAKEDALREKLGKNKLFIGSEEFHQMHENHRHLSGVRKKIQYSPISRREDSAILEDGRILSDEEWREIFDIKEGDPPSAVRDKTEQPDKVAEFERRTHAPLRPEEKQSIQNNINLAREDVSLLAQRVVEQVF